MTRDVQSVLLLLPGAFGVVGGIQMYNRLLIKAFSELMADRGGRCDVLVLNDPPGCFDSRYGTVATREMSFSGNRIRFARAAIVMARRNRPDVIVLGHVHFGALAIAFRAAAKSSRQWFVAHGVDVWHRLRPHVRWALRRADKVLAVSDYTRRELMKCNDLSGENIVLQPNALDPFWVEDFSELAAASSFPDNPVLLTCARLTHDDRYKGIDCVIEAMPAIVASHPTVKFVIVGDGDDKPYLQDLARKYGVEKNVEFRGRASQQELAEAYAGCSLFVMPSRKEGFGIVFLEASFFGKPSIGGAHGGTPEVIVPDVTGELVEHANVPALTTVLLQHLNRPDLTVTQGKNARMHLETNFLYPAYVNHVRSLI